MKSHEKRAFLDEDYNVGVSVKPESVGTDVIDDYEESGLPGPYLDRDAKNKEIGNSNHTTYELSSSVANLALEETDAGKELVFSEDNLE